MNIKFRPHKREDIPYRIKWFSNPRVIRYLGFEEKIRRTRKTENEWFNNYEKEKKKGKKKFFAICDAKKPIGLIGLGKISKVNKNSDIFIIIGDDAYLKKGVATKAIEFIVDYGFKKLRLHKISLGVFVDNKPALGLYKKIGFKVEGTMKDESFFGGKYHNFYSMAIFNKKG